MTAVTVVDYKNVKLNGAKNALLCTVTSTLVGKKVNLGGVDHMMKKSLKAIVDAYVRRIKTDKMPAGKYTIEVDTREGWVGCATDTIKIDVIVK